MKKIVFMGTPDFSVSSLVRLLESNYNVMAVYTQKPKPAGRGMQIQSSAVQKVSEKMGIPVFAPESLRDKPVQDQIAEFCPDFLVVVAYGKILPKEILDIPNIAPINVHGSLLPAWRGAAPIEKSIIENDGSLGVSTMIMDKGMDTGDILLEEKVDLDMSIPMSEFKMKLSKVGADLLIKTLQNFDNIIPKKQNNKLATIAPKIISSDYLLDWSFSADKLQRQIYALHPKCFFEHNSNQIKVLESRAVCEDSHYQFGSVMSLKPFLVKCNGGLLELITLQKPGKKPLSSKDFLNGYQLKVGDLLF